MNEIPVKRCYACRQEKPLAEFYRNRAQKDGHAGRCIPCQKQTMAEQRAKRKANGKAYAYMRSTYDAVRNRMLRKKFKITLAEYQSMWHAQGGACAICGHPQRKRSCRGADCFLAVDHCHATGRVRGLLCDGCNKGLGCFGESPTRLRRAIEYLLKHWQSEGPS